MPTVTDPEIKEKTNTAAPPAYKEPELFAAEVEMESKSSNFAPLLIIVATVLVVGGTIFYFFKMARSVLTVPVATNSINQIMKAQTGGKLRFSVGTIVSSMNEKPNDPHYKLLAKAGILVIKPKSGNSINSALTPAGEKVLSEIKGVDKAKNSDGTTTYLVPLAERKLVKIDKITMIKPNLARVDYIWKWEANRLGKEFDASGALVHDFNTWDRGTLIKDHGVDFYDAAPTKASVTLFENDDGTWKRYVE